MKKLAILFLLFSVFSCTERIDPISPEVGELSQIDYKESSVTMPINFDIGVLQNMLNTKIPRGLVYHQPNGIPGFYKSDIHIYRNDNISFSVQGNKLRFAIPVRITAYAAKRKKLPFGVKVTKTGKGEARTIIYLDVNLNLNQDYSFTASSSLNYDLQKAKIRISLLGDIGGLIGDPHISISIRSLVRPKIDEAIKKSLPDLNGAIEKELNKFDLKNQVQSYWSESGKPIELENNVWISSNPTNIQFNNIASDGKTANIKIGISSILKLQVGEKPETFDSEAPNIKIDQLKEGNFYIYLPTTIQFSELAKKVNDQISGKTYFSEDKKHKVTINNIKLYGSNNDDSRIIIGVDFKGKVSGLFNKSFEGILWFNVLPEYNQETGIVSLKDLELTPETNNIIIDKAIPWLLDKFYMKEVLEKAEFDLSSEINKHKETINDEFSEIELDNLTIYGNLDKLEFEGFNIDENQLSVVISAKGSLNSMFKEE